MGLSKSFTASYFYPYVVPSVISVLCGAALITMGGLLRVIIPGQQMSWALCHIWTGIPLLVGGVLTGCVVVSRCVDKAHPFSACLHTY